MQVSFVIKITPLSKDLINAQHLSCSHSGVLVHALLLHKGPALSDTVPQDAASTHASCRIRHIAQKGVQSTVEICFQPSSAVHEQQRLLPRVTLQAQQTQQAMSVLHTTDRLLVQGR